MRVGLLLPGMLVLLDCAFDTGAFLGVVHASGAKLLVAGQTDRKPVVVAHCADGSHLPMTGELDVHVIETDIDVTGADGTHLSECYRLITTLLDLGAIAPIRAWLRRA